MHTHFERERQNIISYTQKFYIQDNKNARKITETQLFARVSLRKKSIQAFCHTLFYFICSEPIIGGSEKVKFRIPKHNRDLNLPHHFLLNRKNFKSIEQYLGPLPDLKVKNMYRKL